MLLCVCFSLLHTSFVLSVSCLVDACLQCEWYWSAFITKFSVMPVVSLSLRRVQGSTLVCWISFTILITRSQETGFAGDQNHPTGDSRFRNALWILHYNVFAVHGVARVRYERKEITISDSTVPPPLHSSWILSVRCTTSTHSTNRLLLIMSQVGVCFMLL